ncbi:Importin subunit alpha-4, partial [Mucuna pruriens]
MSLRPAGSCSETRKKSYKCGIDGERNRRRREDDLVGIRKNKREDALLKKRRETHASSSAHVVMVERLLSECPAAPLEASDLFKNLIANDYRPPVDDIVKAGFLPGFVDFLTKYDEPQLQLEAVWVLANVTSGKSEYIRLVVELGAIPGLVNLLTSTTTDGIREQAVWALGNIAADSPSNRDLVLNHDALWPLLYKLNSSSGLSMLRVATWSLSNMVRGNPPLNIDQVKATLTVLQRLIHLSDEEVVTDACWALSYLSDDSFHKIQVIIDTGLCPKLVELLLHPSDSVIVPALRTLGNIVNGDDDQTQFVIDNRLLPFLHQLLMHEHEKSISKEACWTISNITAGNRAQIQAVIDADIIPHLIGILNDAEFSIKKEAVWAIINITYGGSDEQIRSVASEGCIKPLCDMLSCPDPQVVSICLEGLTNILEVGKEVDNQMEVQGRVNIFAQIVDECGGSDKIANLLNHENTNIYHRAVRILETFWPQDHLEDPDAHFGVNQPDLPPGGFNFVS